MKEKLVEIESLLELLGYNDLRSVRRWCIKNKIPLFVVGKRTYTVANFLDLFLEKELKLFVDSNYENPEAVMNAIDNDDKTTLVTLMEAPTTENVKIKFKKNKSEMGKAAKNLLDKLKSA